MLRDLFGGGDSSTASQRLTGIGLLAVGPTAWTGWAEWSEAGPRDKRVGLVHAVTTTCDSHRCGRLNPTHVDEPVDPPVVAQGVDVLLGDYERAVPGMHG